MFVNKTELDDHAALLQPVCAGDVRRVHGLPGVDVPSRRAVILGSGNSDRDRFWIALTHDRQDLSTPSSTIIPCRSDAGLSDLVVEAQLTGIIWRLQVGELVGRVSKDDLKEVVIAAQPSVHAGSGRSMAQTSSSAEALDWQRREVESLLALTSDYLGAAFEAQTTWRLDLGIFSVILAQEDLDANLVLSDLMHFLRTRRVYIADEDLRSFWNIAGLIPDTWISACSTEQLPDVMALALTDLTNEHGHRGVSSELDTVRSLDCGEFRTESAVPLRLYSADRLLTAHYVWNNVERDLFWDGPPGEGGPKFCKDLIVLATAHLDTLPNQAGANE